MSFPDGFEATSWTHLFSCPQHTFTEEFTHRGFRHSLQPLFIITHSGISVVECGVNWVKPWLSTLNTIHTCTPATTTNHNKKKQSNHREAFKTLSTIYSSNNSLVFDKTVFLPLEAFTSISLPLLSGGYAPTFLSYLLVSKSSCTCYITPISQIMLHFS